MAVLLIELRRKTIPIFFDMMQCEFMQQKKRNFAKVAQYIILPQLMLPPVPSVLWCCLLGDRKGIRPVKTEWWDTDVVICL